MYPVLFRLGGLEIRTYGLMLILAFLFAIWYVARKVRGYDVLSDKVWDLALVVMVASIVGARAAFVIEHWAEFSGDVGRVFAVWEGGLTMYGGVLLAVPAGFFYMRAQRMPMLKVADAIAPAMAVGIFIGRIGCLFNGCCYGKPTTLPWGITYPLGAEASLKFGHVAVHPSPLYEGVANLLLFGVLFLVARAKRFDGAVLFVFGIGAGLIRFAVDFSRSYADTAYVLPPLTFNQVIALGIVAASAVFFAVFTRRAGASSG